MAMSGPPLDIPCVPLGRFMTEKFDQLAGKTALIESTTGRSLTFRDLSDAVRRCARGLSSLGFKKGDVLCMFSPNVLEYPVLFYAVVSLGGVFQATNPSYIASELQHTIDMCKSKVIVTVPELLPIVKETNFRSRVIVVGKVPGYMSFTELDNSKYSTRPLDDSHVDAKNDVAAILFSSGTTGKPKAVQIKHYGLVANTLQMMASDLMTNNDSFLTFLPFFHIYGLGPILTGGLYAGAKNVVMSRFEPKEYLTNLQKYRIDVLHLVPPVMVLFTTLPIVRKFDLSSVRLVICGAAPLSRDIEAKIIKIFNVPHVTQGYGMTETLVTHLIPPGRSKFGSVGTLLPAAECRIVDPETDRILPVNQDGEIHLRGPTIMKGYLHNPGETAAMVGQDGWLRTGDIGHMDSEGFLYIVDRIKELIKYKGFQVAPAELEDILLSHPDVADVGVIGVPDVEAGELPKAFVVRKPASSVSEQELVKFVAGKVSGTKRLRGGVAFLSEIPKSASGKILRRILRDMEKKKSKL